MRKFTEFEDEFIIDNYKKMSIHQIASSLDRSKSSVCGHAKRLGLKREQPEIIFERLKITAGEHFVGSVPLTYGKEGLKYLLGTNLSNLIPALLRGKIVTIEAE